MIKRRRSVGGVCMAKKVWLLLILFVAAPGAYGDDWHDTAVAYRYGSRFAEPYGRNDISKHIYSLIHSRGDRYGSQFLSIEFLQSDSADPQVVSSGRGAQEVYALYRHTLNLGSYLERDFSFGPVRGVGMTVGLDLNSKQDVSYNSRKQMWVAGPTWMIEVPGFLNISLLALWESNAPHNGVTGVGTPRYYYATHPMLNLVWGIPLHIGGQVFSFEGYGNFIAPKGKNEFGGETVAETNVDMQLMYDLSPALAARRNTLKVGLAYQYWRNKFGNDHTGAAGAGAGAFARTLMVRVESHF